MAEVYVRTSAGFGFLITDYPTQTISTTSRRRVSSSGMANFIRTKFFHDHHRSYKNLISPQARGASGSLWVHVHVARAASFWSSTQATCSIGGSFVKATWSEPEFQPHQNQAWPEKKQTKKTKKGKEKKDLVWNHAGLSLSKDALSLAAGLVTRVAV